MLFKKCLRDIRKQDRFGHTLYSIFLLRAVLGNEDIGHNRHNDFSALFEQQIILHKVDLIHTISTPFLGD
jgi:hypothetical protein